MRSDGFLFCSRIDGRQDFLFNAIIVSGTVRCLRKSANSGPMDGAAVSERKHILSPVRF